MSGFDCLDRREFARKAALAALGGVTITITGCGGSDYGMSSSATGTDRAGTISDNHGHQAVITGAQLMAGGGFALNIRGGADHEHMVDLSGDEIARIRANQTVEKQSTMMAGQLYAMHLHTVTFALGGQPSGPGGY